jgi:NHLM bacteriocin system ABC transporter peptidase/ATP-binding protein
VTAPARTPGRHRRPTGHTRPALPSARIRTPVVLQMEAVECGAAALTMVLGYHGRHVPLEEARVACGVSRDGSTASMLVEAASGYGLEAGGLQLDTDDLSDVPAPCILFWEFNHFVVWEGTGRRFGRPVIFLNDPASGRRTVTPEEFDASFTGVALTFAPGPGFRRGGRRPAVLADLPRRLRGSAGALAIAVVASLLLVLTGLVMPAFTLAFVNSVVVGGQESILGPFFVLMGIAVLMTAALTALQQTYLARMQLVSSLLGHARFFRHLLRLPVGFFSQRSQADLTERLQSNGPVAEILARDVAAVLINSVVVLAYAALLWSYDRQLTLIGVTAALLNVAALRVVVRQRESGVAKLRTERAKFFSASLDGLRLIETMKATGGESGYFRRWAGLHTAVLAEQQKVGVPSAVLASVPPLLAALSSAAVLLIGGLRAVDGAITVGVLVAFQAMLTAFSQPVTELSNVAARVQDFGADLARLRDVEEFPIDPALRRPEPATVHRLEGHLELAAVTFGYSPVGEPLLRDFSFTIGPGEQVALVGGSGSGKSTVSKLISGLYSPWAGQVRLDGRPLAEVPRSSLAASVAFVDQDIFLFEGTVRDNVALWDPSIPDADVIAALRDAAVWDVVSARPGGVTSRVEEGGRNFSGGQRQRLEIARALVRRPSVLVLDEATSALDAETERVVIDNLRRRGCACVVIAHRLSTVRDSDEIIVLDRGEVAERGRHLDLVAAAGAYADLVRDH